MREKIRGLSIIAALSILSGCTPTYNVGLIDSSNAFQSEYVNKHCENKDKESVRTTLGPPSFTNESDTKWYYVGTKVLNRPFFPKIENQKINQITFSSKGIVQNIEISSAAPYTIKHLKNQTPTRLKKTSSIHKIFKFRMTKNKKKKPEKKTLEFY
jgi:outer membrane protein assembly factor BamE (lipoprotein component of BamABCDE complex)